MFLSLDHNCSNGQVIFTYSQKYQGVANSRAHHLIKYMEYKNGPLLFAGSTMLAWQLPWKCYGTRRRNALSPNPNQSSLQLPL